MERKSWGTYGGRSIELFTMELGRGCRAEITNFGGALVGLYVPDKDGVLRDVVLGYDSLQGYVDCTSSLGVLVGRHANRIEGAQFKLNGIRYDLAANDGRNHLHGGPGGFGKVVWEPRVVQGEHGEALQLRYFSPDGEEGYPGNLEVEVTYSPSSAGALRIDYMATSDRDTVVNLTNHAYFNLAGQGEGLILQHELQLYSDFFTPINAECLPTGEIYKVEGTPLDFRTLTPIGARIDNEHDQVRFGQGYDHNWIIRRSGKGLEKAARVEHGPSGRALEVWTTKPGIQFYSGNFLKTALHPRRSGLCLETQYYPNSMRFSHFPSPILRAGERYEHSTIYDFLPEGL